MQKSFSMARLPNLQWVFVKKNEETCEIRANGRGFSVTFHKGKAKGDHIRHIYDGARGQYWNYNSDQAIKEYKQKFTEKTIPNNEFNAKLNRLFSMCTSTYFTESLQLISYSKEQQPNLIADAKLIQDFVRDQMKEWTSIKERKTRIHFNLGDLGLPRSLDVFKHQKKVYVMVLPKINAVGENSDGGGSKKICFCVSWISRKQYVQGQSLPTEEARKEVEKEGKFYETYQGKIRGLPGPMIGMHTCSDERGEYKVYYQEKYDGNLKQLLEANNLSNQQKFSITRQLLATFIDFSLNGIGHFDPKLENVLYRKKGRISLEIAVCDFGSYCQLTDTWIGSIPKTSSNFIDDLKDLLTTGTPGYTPPESWVARYWLRVISKHVDETMKSFQQLTPSKKAAKKLKLLQEELSFIDKIAPKEKRDVFGLGVLLLNLYYKEEKPLVGSNSRMDDVLCLTDIASLIQAQKASVEDKESVTKAVYSKIQKNINKLFREVKQSLSKYNISSESDSPLVLIWLMMQADPKKRISFSKNLENMEVQLADRTAFTQALKETDTPQQKGRRRSGSVSSTSPTRRRVGKSLSVNRSSQKEKGQVDTHTPSTKRRGRVGKHRTVSTTGSTHSTINDSNPTTPKRKKGRGRSESLSSTSPPRRRVGRSSSVSHSQQKEKGQSQPTVDTHTPSKKQRRRVGRHNTVSTTGTQYSAMEQPNSSPPKQEKSHGRRVGRSLSVQQGQRKNDLLMLLEGLKTDTKPTSSAPNRRRSRRKSSIQKPPVKPEKTNSSETKSTSSEGSEG